MKLTDPALRHTDWCSQGHPCGLGEHRSYPISMVVPGSGSLVLTRVRSANGSQHAELRFSINLPGDDAQARLRLAALLTHIRTLIGPARSSRRAA